MSTFQTWDWFAVALLHDIGKITLNKGGTWEDHEDLSKFLDAEKYPSYLSQAQIDFCTLLGQDIVDYIKVHHDELTESREAQALLMADRFQKAMHGISEIKDDDPQFSPLQTNPGFYPYYGQPRTRWWPDDSAHQTLKMVSDLSKMIQGKKPPGLKSLLNFVGSEHFSRFPHTSYIPHISLSIHLRFTAVLFYFIWKKLAEYPDDLIRLKEISFSVITIRPETLGLFYRLRDVDVHHNAIRDLRIQLFGRVFRDYQHDVRGLGPEVNPFEFFDGNSIVLIHDDEPRILNALQAIVDDNKDLRTLDVDIIRYTLKAKWELRDNHPKFYTGEIDIRRRSWSIIAEDALDFPSVTEARCIQCARPLTDEDMDDQICSICRPPEKERNEKEKKRKVLTIEKLSGDGEKKIGYVFLSTPDDLPDHAYDVAESKLISAFMDSRRVKDRLLRPTEGGIFEYLQAVMDVQTFQERIEEELTSMQKGEDGRKDSIRTLLRFPNLMIYILREDQYWPFLGFLNRERESLRLETSLRAILCHPKTPFWSLIENLSEHRAEDVYYDASEGSVVMFSAEEITAIRNLASVATEQDVANKQIMDLSKFAARYGIAELGLEIEARAKARARDEGRIPERFADALQKSLDQPGLQGDDFKAREKRAIFIKYIGKLMGRGEQRDDRRFDRQRKGDRR